MTLYPELITEQQEKKFEWKLYLSRYGQKKYYRLRKLYHLLLNLDADLQWLDYAAA